MQGIRFGSAPYAWMDQLHRDYGDAFTLRLPNDPVRVVFSDPAVVRDIFALRPEQFRSDLQSLHLNIGQDSVLFQDGERHARSRKVLLPPLRSGPLQSYAKTMQQLVRANIAQWPKSESFSLHPQMQSVTLDVILRCVFGVGEDEDGLALRRALMAWAEASLSNGTFALSMVLSANRLRAWLDASTSQALAEGPERRKKKHVRPWRTIGDLKAVLCERLQRSVDQTRREGTNGRTDILALLVDATYEDGQSLSRDEIVDQLVTMLVGGHETTAASACWALQHILSRSDVVAAIGEELAEVFGEGPIDPSRTDELPYLEACIVESMRLSPIAPAVARTLTQDTELGGYALPAGTIVWPCIYLAQRHPGTWDNPDRFEPERFINGKTPRPHEYFPFGGGRRRCIGAAFAQLEMRIVVAEIIASTQLRLAGPEVERGVIRGFTIAPSGGLRVAVA